jgi:hypothetical protein
VQRLKQTIRKLHEPEEQTEITIPKDFGEFNKLIGLPKHPRTKKETRLFQYELDVFDLLNKYRWLLINKARKIGISEIVLRIITFKCFSDYAGYQIMLVAGNRVQHAQRLMRRFQKLFDNISEEIADKTADRLILKNGTEVIAHPSNDTALRGLENVKCIFLDEAAHFNIINDQDVYNALEPNLSNTDGDFIIVSTPNGKRGMFYDLWTDGENRFYKLALPYTVSLGLLLDKKMIERKKKDRTIDFEQEYMCQFTTPKGAFITGDMIEHIEEDYELEDI